MGSVASYTEVNVPVEVAYRWWRGLTNLPSILPDVESVTGTDRTDVSHWVVKGPLGVDVSWDARVVEDKENQRIAWATVDNEATRVPNAGAVRFDQHGETTGVEVSLQFDPPAGLLGEAVAKLFADPQKKVDNALAAYKEILEKATPGSSTAVTVK